MKNQQYKISPPELLFLIHPNSCLGLELVQLTVLNLALSNQLNLFSEKRLITRKKVGNIEQLFFIIQRTNEQAKTKNYESIIIENSTESGSILQNFIKKLDKKLDGIEVFKYEVYLELSKKGLVTSSYTFFGLIKPKYKITEKGKLAKEDAINKINNDNFIFKLISHDSKARVKELGEINESLPLKFKDLINMKSKDWKGANRRSGLSPSGFLPR